jgi:hypothetical protein
MKGADVADPEPKVHPHMSEESQSGAGAAR